jgi:hypothetical protein
MGAVIALCDPQIEFHTRFAEVGGVTAYRGHDSLQSFNQGLQEVWGDEVRIEAEEHFDLGERTLAFYVLRGRGQQSRAEVSILATVVARWRAGLCIYWKSYLEARGKASGVQVDTPVAVVFDFRDDRCSRARTYLDHDEALRAVGLAD